MRLRACACKQQAYDHDPWLHDVSPRWCAYVAHHLGRTTAAVVDFLLQCRRFATPLHLRAMLRFGHASSRQSRSAAIPCIMKASSTTVTPVNAHRCPRKITQRSRERKSCPKPAPSLLAGGGWEGVNPCGKAFGKYLPHPNPPLQAGEGVVRGDHTGLDL